MKKKTSIPRPEHPDPQWERKNWINLNGEWQFEKDFGVSGEDRGLVESETLSGVITLPFCPESELSGVGYKDFMNCVWYKRAIRFTKKELEGKRVILHFGAADFETTVWVNGEKAGLPHVGGYGSFSYEITKFLKARKNLVTVRCVDDCRRGIQPRGKQSEAAFSVGCNYTRTTGIWQTVWLEIVPESYIKYARFFPDAENKSVTVEAELCGRGDFSAEVFFNGKKVGEAKKKNLSVLGTLEVKLSEKHLWELGKGGLYDLVLRFGEDEVKSYFGLRSIELKDGKFYLNGKSVFQRLVLDQGFYPDGIITAPTEKALERDIKISMEAGFNGARLHQKVFEPRFLYHADRLGYMVWGEYGSWGQDLSDLGAIRYFLPDWIETVRRDFNHPAIVTWCPMNETWDYPYGKYRPWEERCRRQNNDVLRVIYEETKKIDPTRPCVDTSGNYHVVTDIFDLHWYEQDPKVFREAYDRLWKEGVLVDRWEDQKRQKWAGEPVHISEYGGIGLKIEQNTESKSRGATWSYGKSAGSYEEFYDRYEGLTTALLDNPRIFGFCYTQLTDVEQEQNGLFEYATRKPKFDLSVIREINQRKAAVEK